MTAEEFCAAYPRLFHMAEASMWPNIQRHGLLSTSALLDLYGVTGPERAVIESQRRPGFVTVEHGTLAPVLIRDQRPMSDATLAPVLVDMTPAEWYALLNARVFFWVNEGRLERLLKAYRHRENVVLVLDSAAVLAQHAAQVTLSPINSGYSLRYAQPRGRGTFLPLAEYPFKEWVKKRGLADAVAECAVLGGVTNVQKALIETRAVPSAK